MQIGETIRPRMISPTGPAKPAAGVTATRPATKPDAKPRPEWRFEMKYSVKAQDKPAAAVAKNVFTIARPA